METVAPRKVIAKVDVRPNRPTTRPVSPFKQSQLRASPSPDITRPRAKVSTSATQKRRVSGTGSASTIGTSPAVSPGPRAPSTIPRPVSPSKYSPAISRVQSAHSSTSYAANDNSAPRAKATLSQTALSRQRSLTGSALSPTVPGSLYTRERRGSTSSSLSASQHLSPESAASASPALRVKSKVTSLAKTAAAPSSAPTSPLISRSAILPACHPSDPSSPSYTTTRPVRSRVRSPPLPEFNSPPSASSVPSSPAIPYSAPYPLSNGTNTHGNGASHSRYQSFSGGHTPASDSSPVLAKVDPAALPPLPQSPPASTTSFSSHSSRSSLSQLAYSSSSSSAAPTVSSVAGASRVHSEAKGDPPGQRAMFDALVDLFDPTSAGTSRHASLEPPSPRLSLPKSEGSQIRAAAKSNRKIEDLEITNRSLLAINSTLEAAKHKQAKEIRELRRRLRESRLILPPRTFRAVKSSQPDLELEEDDDDDEEDEEDLDNVDAISANDEAYKRVRSMIDGLLEVGRRALESTPEEHIGPKVLSAEEARPWRDEESFAEAGDMSIDRDQDPTSEDEVEATLDGDVPSILVGMS